MNSFNHYAYGAIGDWMYRVMTGLDTYTDGPGYKHIKIMPHPGGKFTSASAKLETYYGNVSSGWEVKDGKMYYTVEIPANTKADIFLPAKQVEDITEDSKPLASDKALKVGSYQDGYIGISVGSGIYHFEAPQPPAAPAVAAAK